MIRLSSSRRFDMKSCLLHRVTKLAKLQLGPITVMKVVQQHNNTNSRKEKKKGNGYTSPLSYSSSFHPCCQQNKTVEKEKEWKCKHTSRDSHPPLPHRPLRPALATRLSLFLFQTDRIAFLATPDIQLHHGVLCCST